MMASPMQRRVVNVASHSATARYLMRLKICTLMELISKKETIVAQENSAPSLPASIVIEPASPSSRLSRDDVVSWPAQPSSSPPIPLLTGSSVPFSCVGSHPRSLECRASPSLLLLAKAGCHAVGESLLLSP
ncbi:hypothetical protein FALCPG4_005302 [Fusarium falciforme]